MTEEKELLNELIERGEFFSAKANLVYSKGAPRVDLSLRIVAKLDKVEDMPALIAKGMDELYIKLNEAQLLPGNIM